MDSSINPSEPSASRLAGSFPPDVSLTSASRLTSAFLTSALSFPPDVSLTSGTAVQTSVLLLLFHWDLYPYIRYMQWHSGCQCSAMALMALPCAMRHVQQFS
jgi:hypothetical protein